MISNILDFFKKPGDRTKQYLKDWLKPATATLVTGAVFDITRSKTDLITENAILRQQIIVLNRQIKRPQFKQSDRFRLIFLSRFTQYWQQSLHIVQPDTLLRWHRDLFKKYWRWKSKGKKREPRITQQTIDLIRQMGRDNRLWGAERIRGELLKLGISVSKRTIQKYLDRFRCFSVGSQTWRTFLKNHAHAIWACDFTTVYDLFFRPIYIFVIIQLGTREVIHTAVTRSPSDAWTAQQLREASAWGNGPKYLIRDNDGKFGDQFADVAFGSNIEILKTPVQAPRANSYCERFMGSLRRECLDHMLVLSQPHLKRTVKDYATYFDNARPHQGIDQCIPLLYPEQRPNSAGQVIAYPVLNGLHHDYSRIAYAH